MSQPPYPGYGQQQPVAPAEDPGKTLGIVGLILAFLASLVGLIISIIAFRKSKAAGHKNTLALAGIIVGAVVTLVYVVGGIIGGVAIAKTVQKCGELGPGVHQEGGVTYTCN